MKGEVVLYKVVLLCIATFAVGLGVAYFIYDVLPQHRSPTDVEWHKQFGENPDHLRVMEFQNALKNLQANSAKNPENLSKQLDVQLRIEDLVIKSREAELAKYTPFTPLFSGGVGAVLGLLGGLFA